MLQESHTIRLGVELEAGTCCYPIDMCNSFVRRTVEPVTVRAMLSCPGVGQKDVGAAKKHPVPQQP